MSDFEEFARSQGFSGDFQRGCNGQYKSDLLHFMEKAFMHQQAKINELQKRVDVVGESIESFFDNQVGTPTQREYCNFIAEIKQTLRGTND